MYFDEHEFESHENENDGEPSSYELHCQRIQESNLKRQIARHGDEEMRVGCQAPVGTTPTESFVRSYQFKMPGHRPHPHLPTAVARVKIEAR